jgi:hypothetical protein
MISTFSRMVQGRSTINGFLIFLVIFGWSTWNETPKWVSVTRKTHQQAQGIFCSTDCKIWPVFRRIFSSNPWFVLLLVSCCCWKHCHQDRLLYRALAREVKRIDIHHHYSILFPNYGLTWNTMAFPKNVNPHSAMISLGAVSNLCGSTFMVSTFSAPGSTEWTSESICRHGQELQGRPSSQQVTHVAYGDGS